MPSILGHHALEAPLGYPGAPPVKRALSAAPRAAVLTGAAFTLAVSRKARADPATFNLTGAPGAFFRGKGVLVNALACSLTGAALTAGVGWKARPELWPFKVTGADLTLGVGTKAGAQPAIFHLTGSGATVGFGLNAPTGGLSLAGPAATTQLRWGASIPLGTVAAVGKDLHFARGWGLHTAPAAFACTGRVGTTGLGLTGAVGAFAYRATGMSFASPGHTLVAFSRLRFVLTAGDAKSRGGPKFLCLLVPSWSGVNY